MAPKPQNLHAGLDGQFGMHVKLHSAGWVEKQEKNKKTKEHVADDSAWLKATK